MSKRNDINTVTIGGILARDPIIGDNDRGRYALGTIMSVQSFGERDSKLFIDFSTSRDALVGQFDGLKKGSPVVITGQLGSRKDTNDQWRSSVRVDGLSVLGGTTGVGEEAQAPMGDDDIPF